jgi:vacuolar protein sorting-associated protein 26
MEIVIIRRETCGTAATSTTSTPASLINESINVAKFEIMDGAPFRGESIPLRLFLSPYDLTPTMKNIHNKFSVRYYLNLVLVDEEDRRYFKQQEIVLWRKTLKGSTNVKDIISPTTFEHDPGTVAAQGPAAAATK